VTALAGLAARLVAAGVPPEEVAAAERSGDLALLAIDRLVLPGPPRYDQAELAARAGVPLDLARRLWRALGFTDLPAGERAFGDADVEALRRVSSYLQAGLVDERRLVQLTRAVGSAMARIAEAQTTALQERQGLAGLEPEEALERAIELIGYLRADWEVLLPYVHLRQLQAAAKRAVAVLGRRGATVPAAVGFADLVGFTALSRRLEPGELADVVDRFEAIAFDTAGALGARVVKMIGDEVMFVAQEPSSAVDVGLALVAAYGRGLPSKVRVGVAFGEVLPHGGDYFGPPVNLASRIVDVAHAGSVVVCDQVRAGAADDPRFTWRPIRPRRLKGIGLARLWVVSRRLSP
jgi:adenylate cyclase